MKFYLRSLTLTLIACFALSTSFAQTAFLETFDGIPGPTAGGPGTYAFPAGWMLYNVDNLTPNTNVSYVTAAWTRREDFANDATDSCAFSTSWYAPAGTADDWMVTPAIVVPANGVLAWNAVTYDAGYPDGYEVRIASTNALADHQAGTTLFTTTAENTTWTPRSVSLSAYAGQTVYISFRNNSTDMFLLLIDDVYVGAPIDDAAILSVNGPSQYTAVPSSETAPFVLEGVVSNVGSSTLTNVKLQATITLNGTQVYQASSSPVASLAAGTSTSTLTIAAYTPAAGQLGLYEVTFEALSDGNDANTTNNFASRPYRVGNYFARDDYHTTGVTAGTLGIGAGAGTNGVIGTIYTVTNGITIDSVLFHLGDALSDSISVQIYSMSGGAPATLLAQSTKVLIDANMLNTSTTLGLTSPLVCTPGDYFVAVTEGSGNCGLSYTTNVFTPGTTMVNWTTNPNGTWTFVENFNFSPAYILRPIVAAPVGVTQISTLEKITVNPNPANTLVNIDLKFGEISDINVDLVNMTGQVVASSNVANFVSGTVSFNTAELPSGTYTVRVANAKGISTSRVVIAH